MDSFSKTSCFILCIGQEWFPINSGGSNRYVFELVNQLSSNKDRIELCALDLPISSEKEYLFLTNLAKSSDPVWERMFLIHKNFSNRISAKPDAINLHFVLNSFPLINHFSNQVPITFTFHGPWALESKQEQNNWLNIQLKQWMELQVYRRCDRFIVLSHAFGTILHEIYQVPWEKINIIPGGVDIKSFQPSLSQKTAQEQLGWPTDRPILFTPRRLVHRMGLDKLLQAISLVKKRVADVWLAIAGRGPLQEILSLQVQQLGLSDHVRLLGYLPDDQLPVAYQAADLTVVPTQQLEGFGLIIVESLACGTPVLCTPVGGMPEILEPLCPQLITRSADPDAIAECLIDILCGHISLPSKDVCRGYAVEHYDWQIIADKVRRVLLAR